MLRHFCAKMLVFQFLSTIKVKVVEKIMQNANLCAILQVKDKKVPFLAVNLISTSW